jgi:hypothetical protein
MAGVSRAATGCSGPRAPCAGSGWTSAASQVMSNLRGISLPGDRTVRSPPEATRRLTASASTRSPSMSVQSRSASSNTTER